MGITYPLNWGARGPISFLQGTVSLLGSRRLPGAECELGAILFRCCSTLASSDSLDLFWLLGSTKKPLGHVLKDADLPEFS